MTEEKIRELVRDEVKKFIAGQKVTPVEPGEGQQCAKVWQDTLESFGMDRPVLSYEYKAIADLIRMYGAKEAMYALKGARYEEGGPNFNPKKHVSINRLIENRKLFEYCVNMASIAQTAEKKQKEREAEHAKYRMPLADNEASTTIANLVSQAIGGDSNESAL